MNYFGRPVVLYFCRILRKLFNSWSISDLMTKKLYQKWRQLCLGARSIQHCNVLSEKINFSAHSARRAATFWTDHIDPLNFNVFFFRDSPTPPLCLKMAKCAIFSHFCGTHFENTPKVGVHREKFYIGNFSQIFLVISIYVGSMSFHFQKMFNKKFFTVTVNVTITRIPRTF